MSSLSTHGINLGAKEANGVLRGFYRFLATRSGQQSSKLGSELLLRAPRCAGALAEQAARRGELPALLAKAGLAYDAATSNWLSAHKADDLLKLLEGFQLTSEGFVRLVKEIQQPTEFARVRALANFVRQRPWLNADLTTLQGLRAALPSGKVPATEEIARVLNQVDGRFRRDYQLAPEWVPDAHTWEYVAHNEKAGDEGGSYWLRNPAGEWFMAKIPPETRRGVNERFGYALHTALGLNSNEVRYGQRDWLPIITLHKRIAGDPVALDRVARDIGLASADYRVERWPYPADNIGTGPSNWNRPSAEVYQASIAPRLTDPAIFDKLAFVGRITDDPDLKPGNILATVSGNTADGEPVYDIHRIDFGIMMDGYRLRDLSNDLRIFKNYLASLLEPINRVHLRNILATMKQFASLNDTHLLDNLLRGIRQNADGSPAELLATEYEVQARQRLVNKRGLVREWLEKNSSLASGGF